MEKTVITKVVAHFHKDKFFRYVNNYEYCFRTFAKQRWLKREILELFIKEFKAFSESYYRRAIETNRILVNGEIVSGSYLIR